MTMDTDLTHLLYFIVYQVFPYVVITVWLVGSLSLIPISEPTRH